MSVHYSVRCCPPHEEESELLRLWKDNLPLRCEAAEKFAWTYRQGPIPPADVFLLSVERANGVSVVGTSGVGIRRFKLAELTVDAALLGDFAVDAAHRTLMPATILMRTVRRRGGDDWTRETMWEVLGQHYEVGEFINRGRDGTVLPAEVVAINGQPVAAHPMARFLMDAGFHPGPLGMHLRRILLPVGQNLNESHPGEVQ